jgi:lipopolysaccharide transport system ATP-binding protein
MSDTVIKVENLSKKYFLRHEQPERYVALRDVMARRVKNFGKKLVSPLTSASHPSTPSKEEFYALKDISFEVKRGERVGIIGRNGAGKSTLLKILSRITEPTTGRIEIRGRVASLLEVGTGFHPELTGRENIFLNGAILGMTKAEIKRKFDEIVAFAEIEKFLDTPVKHFSSGMYVRLAFAVAAHLEPEILIVDEVLAVGDAEFQKRCLGKMSEITNKGKTVLFVSHNMGAVSSLCGSGLLLIEGAGSYYKEIDACIAEYMMHASSCSDEIIVLRNLRRPDVGLREGAKFVDTQMVNDGQHQPWKIPFPLAPEIKFSVEVSKAVPNLELGIALYNRERVEIMSSLSSDFVTIRELVPGIYDFTAAYQDILLVPGHYSMGIGLRSDLGFEDYIPDALAFEVTASKESGDAKTYTRKGSIIPKIKYDIHGAQGGAFETNSGLLLESWDHRRKT